MDPAVSLRESSRPYGTAFEAEFWTRLFAEDPRPFVEIVRDPGIVYQGEPLPEPPPGYYWYRSVGCFVDLDVYRLWSRSLGYEPTPG